MLFWGAVASLAVGALTGGGGGGGGILGSIFGGLFGGGDKGGGAGGIGGWLGGLLRNVFSGLFAPREQAANNAVNQELANNPVQQQPVQQQPAQQQPVTNLPTGDTSSSETQSSCCCCCCHNDSSGETDGPSSTDTSSGGLTVEGDVITTSGGYQIEMVGKYEWKITGPDGKSTRIWGDPHVEESDGGKWDFKRDTTFVLPDGTEIHCDTIEHGSSGWTVTGGLTVINGNDRVVVTDIDKGKGNIGTVTQDGLQYTNSFGDYDVVVAGQETDDWSFQGKEIVGSKNQGSEFVLGGDLHPGYGQSPVEVENPDVQPVVTTNPNGGNGGLNIDAALRPGSLSFSLNWDFASITDRNGRAPEA